MGIRFLCPNGHKLNVKTFLAGKRAICPDCGARVIVPDVPEPSVTEHEQSSGFLPDDPGPGSSLEGFATARPNTTVVLEFAERSDSSPAPPERRAGMPVPSVGALPESIVAVASQTTTAEPANSGEVAPDLHRERRRRNQMAMAVVLFMVVLVLAGVLIWVLKRNPPTLIDDQQPAEKANRNETTFKRDYDPFHSAIARM